MKETEFLKLLVKLSPEEFLGVARILKVSLLKNPEEEDPRKLEPRGFEDIIVDINQNFELEGRKRKRELLRIMRAAVKTKD